MANEIQVGVIGAAGYTGGELIRVLLNHPYAKIKYAHSKSNAGKPVSNVHADLIGETDLCFADSYNDEVDVMILCVGHGDAVKFLSENNFSSRLKIIDLSQDYRLKSGDQLPLYNGVPFVYGLPELNRDIIQQAQYIANPGCFATAIQLGLLPLAGAGLLKDVYTTGITGSTGAGQSLSATSHFSWRSNNIQAYKTLTHQHLHEIGQSINQLQKEGEVEINFVPWRGDFARGIFISSTFSCNLELNEVVQLFENFYQSHPFTTVSRQNISLKQVANTNKAVICIEKSGTKIVVHSAIDNLLKGASGQAIQNMNLIFGVEETAGLKLKATVF